MPTLPQIAHVLDQELTVQGLLFRYDIDPTGVVCRAKTHDQIALGQPQWVADAARGRADAYAELFRQALPHARLRRSISLGIDVGDIPMPIEDRLPLFGFQRRRGRRVLLLPDVDLLLMGYFEEPHWTDARPFRRKHDRAIFVGSTTGGSITMETVRALDLPRLRAAAAFTGSEAVTFLLPHVVQCDNPETEAALRALGFGEARVEWDDQLAFRHLISIDGNGATCSRVAIALKSNSVLLKYDSDHELFYFKGLRPWRDYVPIAQDSEVEAAVADCAAYPGRYARIARAGARFFRAHLTRSACVRYTAALLRGYAELVDAAEGRA